jgi:hypothetical protein
MSPSGHARLPHFSFLNFYFLDSTGTPMPPTVVPFTASEEGAYVVLEAVLSGQPPRNIGVLLADPASSKPWIRMLPAYDLAEPEYAEA